MYDCFLAARIGRQPNSVRYARLIANRPVKEETSDVKIEPAVKIKTSFRPPEPHTSRPSVLPIIQARNNPNVQDIPRRLQPLADDTMMLPFILTTVILGKPHCCSLKLVSRSASGLCIGDAGSV